VQLGQRVESLAAPIGEDQPDHPVVHRIGEPLDEAVGNRPIHQADGAGMPQEEGVGDLLDGWPPGAWASCRWSTGIGRDSWEW
jgi:hypothetical protein